jgi:hypothetical protein
MKRVCAGIFAASVTDSIAAEPPWAAAENDAARTVATTLADAGTSIVMIALPA